MANEGRTSGRNTGEKEIEPEILVRFSMSVQFVEPEKGIETDERSDKIRQGGDGLQNLNAIECDWWGISHCCIVVLK